MRYAINAFTDITLGAMVTDIDLRDLDVASWSLLYEEFLTYGLLIFPDQHLTREEQSRFASLLGEVEKLSPNQRGNTIPISNKKPDGSLAQPDDYQFQILKGNEGWHTDSTYMPLASKAAMLAAVVVPPEGGETEFADMRAAYDALEPDIAAYLETLQAYHSLYYSQERAGYQHETDNAYGLHDRGAPLRDVIKEHPETGRKSIYTGRHAYGIPGLSEAASQELLDRLLEEACQPPRVYRHSWQVGDLVLWDNRCLMHRACPYDGSYPRELRGSRISGDTASELAPTFADPRAADFVAATPE
ncbi:MAG: TauD/TfdA family dioxygenase [Pseudomonadota bacterium]